MDLDTLFVCPATAKHIAIKHCLRRQSEQRLGLPVYQGCRSCALGAEHRKAAVAAGVPIEPEACAARAEAVPPEPKPTPSEHLWAEDRADPPLPAPPSAAKAPPRIGLAVVARVHDREERLPPGAKLPALPEGVKVKPADPKRAAELVRQAARPEGKPPPVVVEKRAAPEPAAAKPTKPPVRYCKDGCGKKLRRDNRTGWASGCQSHHAARRVERTDLAKVPTAELGAWWREYRAALDAIEAELQRRRNDVDAALSGIEAR